MRSSWLPALLVGGTLLVTLAACSDSSDVGLGVGSDPLNGGAPRTLDATPALNTTRTAPVTGDNARARPQSQNAWRFLVGKVDDPVGGTGVVEAEGYVDFAGRSSIPSEITPESGSVTAEVVLTTEYFHGYSTESIDVEVYDLTEEADMDSARASTSFNAGSSPVSVDTARINLSGSDSLATIRLQDSWVNENSEVFQTGESFEDNFHGFKITAPNSEAIVGFSSSDATLRLRTVSSSDDTTTADYSGLKTFTHVEQRGVSEEPPDGYRLMQDGVGTGLTMEWTFEAPPLDTLESDPLNRAEIFVPNDTSALEMRSDFRRPDPQGYRIVATESADAALPSNVRRTVFPLSENDYALPLVPSEAPAAALAPDNVSLPTFEQSLRRVRNGQSPVFTTFRVHIADRENTSVNQAATVQPGLPTTLPVLVPIDGTEPGPPRATLTVTPL